MKRTGCVVCGRDLPSRRTKFCADTCAAFFEFKRREKRISLRSLFKPRACLNCGDEFQPKSERHVYCTKVCWGIITADRRKKKRERHKDLGISNTVWNQQTKGFRGTAGSGNRNRKIGQYGSVVAAKIPKIEVETANFTTPDTKERVELQAKVEEYLAKGGKITKYGAQVAIIKEEVLPSWQVTEEEEQSAVDDYREVDVYHGN